MVCDRCLMSVEKTLQQQNLNYRNISLGRIDFENELSEAQFQGLEEELNANGFEIVAERNNKIVTDIKSLIIELVYEHKDSGNKKLSEVLSDVNSFSNRDISVVKF